jgi:hypothetical protein
MEQKERDVKETDENFIQIIEGKLESGTSKRKNKKNLENGGQGRIGS